MIHFDDVDNQRCLFLETSVDVQAKKKMHHPSFSERSKETKQRLLTTMADRITTLEDALRIQCDGSHPLLPSNVSHFSPPKENASKAEQEGRFELTLEVRSRLLCDDKGQRFFGAATAEVRRI